MAAAANGLGAVHGGGWAEGVCKLGLNPKGLEQVGAGSWDSWESTLERPEELTMRGVWSDDTSGVSGLKEMSTGGLRLDTLVSTDTLLACCSLPKACLSLLPWRLTSGSEMRAWPALVSSLLSACRGDAKCTERPPTDAPRAKEECVAGEAVLPLARRLSWRPK